MILSSACQQWQHDQAANAAQDTRSYTTHGGTISEARFRLRGHAYEKSHSRPKEAVNSLMPKGPQGQKRPSDVIGNAVKVMQIATDEVEEKLPERSAAAELGSKGGRARAANLSKAKRAEIAKKAAKARWG